MALHPTAEAYRQALAAGDSTRAASLIVDAHKGSYNADLIDQIHTVGRMTRAELNAPADEDDSAGVIPRITVENRTTIWRRRI